MAAAKSPEAPPTEATAAEAAAAEVSPTEATAAKATAAEVSPSETTAAKSASVAFFGRAKYERGNYDTGGCEYGELSDHSLPPQM